MDHKANTLRLKRLGIDTYLENIILMRADCQICISEGFSALTRVMVRYNDKSIIATLNVVHSDLITHGEAVLSEIAFQTLGAGEGDVVSIHHLKPIESLSDVRAKMYGRKLGDEAIQQIIADISEGRYSNIELASFVTACSGDNLDLEEIISLTKAMIRSGRRMNWDNGPIFDKHSIGGLPGNRTTPIVVAIAAEAGLTIPKTSSKAITSPAGTADTVGVITNVNLSIEQIRETVQKEGACLAWGGGVSLSPVDDILISVEKALDVDSLGQMIASVLSKKAAAGSTHVVIDAPVGKTAKIRTPEEALRLQHYFAAVAHAINLHVEVVITDGSQPVGRGIGPVLEAMDVLSVLRNETTAPADLKERSLILAGRLLEIAGGTARTEAIAAARKILESGKAWEKFQRICLAQGKLAEPEEARHREEIRAAASGIITAIDNRRLAKLAKLAGAPRSPGAGILFGAPIGKKVKKGETLFTIFSESKGQLEYTLDYMKLQNNTITIE